VVLEVAMVEEKDSIATRSLSGRSSL